MPPLVARKRALVVDDDADLGDVLNQALTDGGYEGIAARNGAEAFDHLRSALGLDVSHVQTSLSSLTTPSIPPSPLWPTT